MERVEQLNVVQEGQIDKLASHNCYLEARSLYLNDNNTAFQCIVMSIIVSVFK